MYVKKLWEGYHCIKIGDDNDCYEPVRDDMTCGLVLGYQEAVNPVKEHNHPEIEQIYYIRSGRGIMRVDDEEQEVGTDTVVFVPAGASHGIRPVEGEKNLTYLYISHYHEVSSKDK